MLRIYSYLFIISFASFMFILLDTRNYILQKYEYVGGHLGTFFENVCTFFKGFVIILVIVPCPLTMLIDIFYHDNYTNEVDKVLKFNCNWRKKEF